MMSFELHADRAERFKGMRQEQVFALGVDAGAACWGVLQTSRNISFLTCK